MTSAQVAVRAVIVDQGRVLLVNGDGSGDFWCLPGGRLEYAESLHDGVRREVYEETGLQVNVGDVLAVCEFVYPARTYHTVETIFRCTIEAGHISQDWVDTGGPVKDRRFFTLEELQNLNVFPRFLRDGTWLYTKPVEKIYYGQDVKE